MSACSVVGSLKKDRSGVERQKVPDSTSSRSRGSVVTALQAGSISLPILLWKLAGRIIGSASSNSNTYYSLFSKTNKCLMLSLCWLHVPQLPGIQNDTADPQSIAPVTWYLLVPYSTSSPHHSGRSPASFRFFRLQPQPSFDLLRRSTPCCCRQVTLP